MSFVRELNRVMNDAINAPLSADEIVLVRKMMQKCEDAAKEGKWRVDDLPLPMPKQKILKTLEAEGIFGFVTSDTSWSLCGWDDAYMNTTKIEPK